MLVVCLIDVVRIQGLASILDSLFGVGSGRIIYRSTAALLDENSTAMQRACMTRKMGHLSTVAGNIIHNYRVLHTALHARMEQARDGRGSKSQKTLVELSRRFSSIDFIVFASVFDGIMALYRPLVMTTQGLSQEPWLVHGCITSTRQSLSNCVEALFYLRRFIQDSKFLFEGLAHTNFRFPE
jgi:hypothetical protein